MSNTTTTASLARIDCCGARFFAGEHCDACGKTVPAPTTFVAIYADGMGTYQARCMGCPWRGRWSRKQSVAVEDGKTHVHR